jgi:hypothetical protein
MSEPELDDISLNHVAFTVTRDILERQRAQIVDFFCGCLDFTETKSSPGNLMMVHKRPDVHRWDFGSTYVVFITKEKPATANPGRGSDHVGISCRSLDQYNLYLDRTKKYLDKYGITANIDIHARAATDKVQTTEPYLHGFYVRPFDAPVAIEIQYLEKADS